MSLRVPVMMKEVFEATEMWESCHVKHKNREEDNDTGEEGD